MRKNSGKMPRYLEKNGEGGDCRRLDLRLSKGRRKRKNIDTELKQR